MEERQKVFDNNLINLLQANFHSSHYNDNTSDSGQNGSKHSYFSITGNPHTKGYEHFLSGSGGHAAEPQSSSSICFNSSTCVKDYGFFLF